MSCCFKSLWNTSPTISAAMAKRTNMINAELKFASSAICEAINPVPQITATSSRDRLPMIKAPPMI